MLRKIVFLVLLATCCGDFSSHTYGQMKSSKLSRGMKPAGTNTVGQGTVKLFPSVIRVQKGKTKTITAVAHDSNGQPVFNAAFTNFSSTNDGVASLSSALISGDDISVPLAPPPNLRSIRGNSAGTVTVRATWNGITSNPATIVVDDPGMAPVAVMHGDNDANGGTVIDTIVGEAVELSAESSQGVNEVEWSWGDGDKTTDLLSATHAFLVAGNYSLTLKITNDLGQSSTRTVSVNAHPQAPPTRTVYVTTIAGLLSAYNAATGGEHIVIPAGTVLDGEIVLPARNFTDYVTIRSSAQMPELTNRVAPDQSGLVTIRGTYANAVPLTIQKGASKIRLSGLKFEPKYIPDSYGPSTYYLVQIGEAFSQTDVSQNPSKIILEHCVVNPPDDVSVVHAVLNDGYKVSVISSWLGNIRTFGGADSQAVASFDGRGAHVYNNTFLEAVSENVLYGGVKPRIEGLTSANIEFRRCHFSKRLAWRVYNGSSHPLNVKNLLETKNARRVYIEGCVFENHWDALRSQLFALVFKSSTMPGAIGDFVPWAISEDIVMENDKVSHIYGGQTTAVDNSGLGPFFGLKPNNIAIKNVLFDDLSERWGFPGNYGTGSGGRLIQPNNVEDLELDHVTVIDKDHSAGTSVVFVSNNNFRFKLTNSIFGLGGYGIIGGGTGVGIMALNPGTSGLLSGCSRDASSTWRLSNNVMPSYGLDVGCFPNQAEYLNHFTTTYSEVGFADLNNNDYTLASSSPYRGTAADGNDPGVNVPVLNDRTGCSVSGITLPCIATPSSEAFSVDGRVVDDLQQPVPNTVVTMTSMDGVQRFARTSSFGYYTFTGVYRGQYAFSVSGRKGRSLAVVQMVNQNTTLQPLVAHQGTF